MFTSGQIDKRPHCHHSRTLQSHLPGGANVTPSSTPQLASTPREFWYVLSRIHYINHRTYSGMSWAGPFSPPKLPLNLWGSGPPSNAWFLGTPKSTTQTASQLVHLFARSLMVITNRQTDRPCYSVCSNRPHLASAAMWPNNVTSRKM